MIYNYDIYDFEIIFNADDFVVNINDNENLFGNVFMYENIKIENNFFNDHNIIQKFIINCFDKKNNYKLELYIKNKILNINFTFTNELNDISLKLDFYPIRKDISTNNEIIELKRKIIKLELITKKFDFNNYIFHDSLLFPINLSYTDTICFSNINNLYIGFTISGGGISNLYVKSLESNTNKNEENKFINYNISKLNFNDEFKLLKNNEIIFYNIEITNLIMNNLSENVKILKLLKCSINISSIENILNLTNIYLFDCNIKNITGLCEMKNKIDLRLYGTNLSDNLPFNFTKLKHCDAININLI